MSLRESIIEYLERNKRMDLDQLYSLCGRERKKTSNAERRLRELTSPIHKSYNPNIRLEKNAKGAIIAYKWEGQFKPFTVTATTTTCCFWFSKYGQHSKECEKMKVSKLF